VKVALNIAQSTGVVTIDRRNVLRRHRKKRVRTHTRYEHIIMLHIIMFYLPCIHLYTHSYYILCSHECSAYLYFMQTAKYLLELENMNNIVVDVYRTYLLHMHRKKTERNET